MRIAIVYDCLYPYTVGGAERRYRTLVAQLAQRHEVTYLTRRQWDGASCEAPPRVAVVAVSGGRRLYAASGRRRILPPLRFGWGIFRYLLRHRRDFDVVHTCSFPYFSLIAARLACAFGGPPVVTDWYEVWTKAYWREYLGAGAGRIGAAVQALCVRLTGPAFVFSALHAARLREEGYRGRPILLKGTYAGPVVEPADPAVASEPLVVYVGRHIPEKQVPSIPAAIALARAHIPGLRATIFGDGPDRERVLGEIARLGLQDVIDCPGFARWETVDGALRRAMCLILPSRREGLGLGIVEALARGTPAVVARGPDTAATELIETDRNGVIAESAEPAVLAGAIAAVHAGGAPLRARTRSWFAANAARLTIDASIVELEAVYAAAMRRGALPAPVGKGVEVREVP